MKLYFLTHKDEDEALCASLINKYANKQTASCLSAAERGTERQRRRGHREREDSEREGQTREQTDREGDRQRERGQRGVCLLLQDLGCSLQEHLCQTLKTVLWFLLLQML